MVDTHATVLARAVELKNENERLRGEVERLKAALKNISVMYERWYSDGTVTDAGHIAYEMHACAASARKEGE